MYKLGDEDISDTGIVWIVVASVLSFFAAFLYGDLVSSCALHHVFHQLSDVP